MRSLDNILIIRFSSLGDIVLALPLIRVLRAAYPLARIDFLVKSNYAELLKDNPHLSSVITLKESSPSDRQTRHPFISDELQALKKRIREKKYDAIIDIHNSLRSRYLRTFSRARYVRVVNKRAMARLALVKFKWNLYGEVVPVADRYIETVKTFGIRNDDQGLDLFVPEDVRFSVDAMMSRYKLERYDTVIGLAPMARHATKRWAAERYVDFGVRIAKTLRAKIFIFGGDEERQECSDMAQMINAQLGSPSAESFAGRLSLIETAAAMDKCSLVVSNDTGLMHLAASRKRKVIAIFGSTVKEFGFFPYGTEHRVIEHPGMPCRPCSHIGLRRCPKEHFRCMKEISVDSVFHAAHDILRKMEATTPMENTHS